MEVLQAQLNLPPTGEGSIPLVFRRQAPFKGEIRVRINDLPKGIVAEPLTIAEGTVSGNIQIKAAEAAPGEYNIKLVALTDISGRKQTPDYGLPPQPIHLIIAVPPAKGNG